MEEFIDEEPPTPEEEPRSARGIPILKAGDVGGAEIHSIFDARRAKVVKSPVLERVIDVQLQLERVLAEAEVIHRKASEEADEIREQAREQGLREGHEEALKLVALARAEYGRLQEAAQTDMLTLAFGIAQRLIGKAIELNPQVVNSIVSQQLEYVRGRRQVTILVHPEDLLVVEGARGEFANQLEGAALYFDADPSVSRGGCVIETESGRIDARLEVQLGILRDAIERR
ncbi:MAG: FliH/SctL family protein [Bradymonadaceae bacterium]